MWYKFALKPNNPDFEEAKKYNKPDEFVTSKGLPVYHGTDAEFNPEEMKNETESINSYGLLGNHPTQRNGIFFSNSREFAARYGKRILHCYLDIKNPAEINPQLREEFADSIDPWAERELWTQAKYGQHDWSLFEDELGKRFIEFLKEEGYDGAIFDEYLNEDDTDYEGKTYVAFDASQIKTIEQLNNIWNEAQKPRQLDLEFEEEL